MTAEGQRPRASLARIVEDLGATLLDLVHGDVERAGDVGGIAIHDPLDEPALPDRALVLGVGLDPQRRAAEVADLVDTLGVNGALALVLRAPVPSGGPIAEASARTGVVVFGLTRGAAWTQVAAMLRSMLAEGDVGADAGPDTLSGDLFALANAVSSLLDAPVTIEDRSSRVLAFSGRQDEADPSRVETILGRQVPERYSRLLAERGVFRDLYRSDRPVTVAPLRTEDGETTLPRVAVSVRAGDEVLGSIWVVEREPFGSDRLQAMRDAAKVVALHMLRIRAGADVGRRLRADLVGTALEGGVAAPEAVRRLGLADQPVVVLALAIRQCDEDRTSLDGDASTVTELQRTADALAMHLGALHPRCAAALVGDVAYGLVPVVGDVAEGTDRAVRVAQQFLDRVGGRVPAVIGVSHVVADTAQLSLAREGADRALRVLRTGERKHQVARLDDVHVESLLLELRDLVVARGDEPTGAVARLGAYDAEHHTNLVATLRAWLDAFGDTAAAAASLYVHPNTFRYRLRRLAEVGGLDLADPDARFAAMLQLRVISRP